MSSSSASPWLLTLLMLCAGCGTNFNRQPASQSTSIAGTWHLQQPDRDQLANTLRTEMERAQAIEEAEFRREYKRARERGSRDDIDINPPPDAAAASDRKDRPGNWMVRESRARNDALLAIVLPSKVLGITQSPTRIELLPEGGARRRFDVAVPSTLVNSYAAFRIDSGWEGNVFVVQSRDADEGIRIVERYQRLGNTLQLQVQLKLPDAKTQQFTAQYVMR